MKSLAINRESGTFIRERNRFVYTRSNLEYLELRVHSVVSIFLGEWFLDQSLGIPYIPKDDQKIIEHRVLIESALRAKIVGVKGIKRLTRFDSDFEPRRRILTVSFTAETDSGELLEMDDVWTAPSLGGGR